LFTLTLIRFKFVRVERYISDLISLIEHRAGDAGHFRASQKDDPEHNLLGSDEVRFIHNAAVVDDAINFVSCTSSSIEPELEKHKVDDAVTVDKKQNNNDIQRPEEEDKQHFQSTATTNTVS
jgi:hypothetical protein